ncbi:hypothetical protein ACN2WE_05135 [Streptomyces sp. cg28]
MPNDRLNSGQADEPDTATEPKHDFDETPQEAARWDRLYWNRDEE